MKGAALSYPGTSRVGARLRWAGLFGLIAVLSLALAPGVADAKKKKDRVKVASYNLYLGSDLADATNAGLASRTDLFADEVGEVLSDVQVNDFRVRATTIAKKIKKKKIDLVGLQEAALWKIEIPTDGGGPPRGTSANVVLIDYIDTLVDKLNKKAKSKKQCGKIAKKRIAEGKKPKPCYRGYRLVGFQQEADVEQLGDFDNNPGPNGTTFDISNSASLGAAAPSRWLEGNDDIGINLGEPPAAQCSDGIDNDGDGKIDYGPAGTNETSGPAFAGTQGLNSPAPPWDCETRLDNSETDINPGPPTANTDPSGLPQDANFDHNIYTYFKNGPGFPAGVQSPDDGTPTCTPSAGCPLGVSYDAAGNGLDKPGITDCNPSVPGPQDTSPDRGPAQGFDPDTGAGPVPPWPFAGYDGDEEPQPGFQVPVCVFHGIDGDLRLQMRDAIIKRKGAGVKTRNVKGGNFSSAFQVTVFGTQLKFTRGWIATDASVRGKKFRLVNTHLESESVGTVREDQASELVASGGPATAPKTVLVGDLNSDPTREATNLPDGDGGSKLAIDRLFAVGFFPVEPPGFSGGHGELLNDLSNTLDNGRIDHILANNPSIRFRSGTILDPIGGGLWASDHGGVFSRLKVPGGKKK
jgi:endonuclease/exonuclease/phosphatase family metal-dependent hydrolase